MPYILTGSVTDGSSTKIDFEPKEFRRSRSYSRLVLGLELPPNELSEIPPTLLVVAKPRWRALPDVFGWSIGPHMISPRLKEKIEELEPGRHRFHPIEIKTTRPFMGKTEHGQYYLILPPPRIDCVIIDRTEFASGMGREGMEMRPKGGTIKFAGGAEPQIVLSAASIAGRHLWQLPEEWDPQLLCSDELRAFYKANKMKGWDMQRCLTDS